MDKTCARCSAVKPETDFSPRTKKCKPCVAAEARQNRSERARLGLCACGQPPEENNKVCSKCLASQRLRYAETQSYVARNGPTASKKRPGRWAKDGESAERVCRACGEQKPISEFQEQNFTRNGGRVTHRHVCYVCENVKSVERVAKMRSHGICTRCGERPASGGYLTCVPCREFHAGYKKALREEVLLRYGAKCSRCGDLRIECLTFDHVGGWGKEHLGDKGRRVGSYSLWKWARDNDYPDTIRLLCGSCHVSLRSQVAGPV